MLMTSTNAQNPAAAPGRGVVAQDRSSPRSQPLRVFIVEDSDIILESLVATLEEMAPVRVVGNAADETAARQALLRMQREVDLVIVDVFLKAGSGLGLLTWASGAGLSGRCVVLTNYATADMREKCLRLGAARVFDKSNDLDELLSYCTQASTSTGDGRSN